MLRQSYGGGSRASGLAGRWAVRVEVALVFALLLVTGLLARSYLALESAEPGYDPRDVLVFEINPNQPRYREPAALARFLETLTAQLKALPAGDRITIAGPHVPPRTFARTDVSVAPSSGSTVVVERVDTHRVQPGYFELLGMVMRSGRSFQAADRDGAVPVAAVSESLARRLWPGEPALGRQLFLAHAPAPVTIVGVVGDVKYAGVRSNRPGDLDLYLPLAQSPIRYLSIAARAAGDAPALQAAIRQTLHDVDPDLPVLASSSIGARLAAQRSDTRLQALVLLVLGTVGTMLAMTGVYAVLASAVRERWRELAIRLTLGEAPGPLARRLLADGLSLVAGGLAAGLALAALAARAVAHLLFGVQPFDLPTAATAAGLILLAAVGAAYLPARRVLRLDPVEALRET
jgi:predicted permease